MCNQPEPSSTTSLIRSKFDATQLWEQVISFLIVLFIIMDLTVKIQNFFMLPKKQIISLQPATEKLENRKTQWCTMLGKPAIHF